MHTDNSTHCSVALPETARAVRATGAAIGQQMWTEGAKA